MFRILEYILLLISHFIHDLNACFYMFHFLCLDVHLFQNVDNKHSATKFQTNVWLFFSIYNNDCIDPMGEIWEWYRIKAMNDGEEYRLEDGQI